MLIFEGENLVYVILLAILLIYLIYKTEPREEHKGIFTDEAEALINQIWNPQAKQTEIFAKGNGAVISRKDLLTLYGLNWLNDEVINFYTWMICQRSLQNTNLPKVLF